eukprot:scaffold132888_cov60-Phaeocystis_antarctica.AAC.1
MHAERTQQQRDHVVEKFRTGKVWVLVCTELMARSTVSTVDPAPPAHPHTCRLAGMYGSTYMPWMWPACMWSRCTRSAAALAGEPQPGGAGADGVRSVAAALLVRAVATL